MNNVKIQRDATVRRDANGVIGVLISCHKIVSRKHNVRIRLATDYNYNLCTFMFLNKETSMFVAVQAEADRKGINLYACLYELCMQGVAIYQRVVPQMRFVSVDANYTQKRFLKNI